MLAILLAKIVMVAEEVLIEEAAKFKMGGVVVELLIEEAAKFKMGVVAVEVLMEVTATPKVVAADLTSPKMTMALKKLKKQSVVPLNSNEAARTSANQINSEKSSQDLIIIQASVT